MRKCKTLLEQRADFVKQEINKAANTNKKVAELSQKLFVSERTVWRDLTK